MFWHNFKYELVNSIRQKEVVFWLICFPIILGTFFHVAFSNIYEKTENFSAVPVSIVETTENENFNSVIKEISKGDDALLKVNYTTKENALKKLESEDIKGIIFVGDDISLSVSGNGIEQTIVKSFLEQYKVRENLIIDTIKNNPQNLEAVVSKMSEEINCNENIPLTEGNMDFMIQYFYNLIAMVAILGSMTGLHIAIENQGNLSQLGARKCCSPTNKFVSLSSALCGSFVVQTICMITTVTFIVYILRVDMGNNVPFVYLSAILGGILGVSFGFFIGSIGRLSEGLKTAVAMSISMTLCFLSGLMVGNMKAVVEEHIPFFNNINPAAVISDSFYCLNIFSDYERFTEKIITMGITSLVFIIGGFLLTRRRKYASL